MIKIEFDKPDDAKVKYLKMVKPGVINRLNIFKKTLDDLKGPATRVVNDNIDSYKVTTRELINLVANPKLPETQFAAPIYIASVDNYVADPNNKLSHLNMAGLRRFTEDLLDQSTKTLDDLLTCPVTELTKLNVKLLKKYQLNNDLHKTAIKLIFNYKRWKEIAKQIKDFFREENIVLYCPYCNMLEADYSTNDQGEDSTIHYLDHFYDKATTPLLGYSMYNLVPCDGMCNGGTIKHDTPFNDKYHVSPYERGFDKAMMVFQAIPGNVSEPLKEIYLKVIPTFGSAEYRRLVGNCKKIYEKSEKGNINVFNLKSRYNRPQILKQNGPVVRKLEAHIANRSSLRTFLMDMNLQQNLGNYERWYFEEFKVEFDEKKFHENPYSKLIRDIHDDIVINSDKKNNDLKAFIK